MNKKTMRKILQTALTELTMVREQNGQIVGVRLVFDTPVKIGRYTVILNDSSVKRKNDKVYEEYVFSVRSGKTTYYATLTEIFDKNYQKLKSNVSFDIVS